jgi:hypothetical protein
MRAAAGAGHRRHVPSGFVSGPPPIDVAAIRAYCDGRVPSKFLGQYRVEAAVDGNAVTIVERRPPWREDFGSEWTAGLGMIRRVMTPYSPHDHR